MAEEELWEGPNREVGGNDGKEANPKNDNGTVRVLTDWWQEQNSAVGKQHDQSEETVKTQFMSGVDPEDLHCESVIDEPSN